MVSKWTEGGHKHGGVAYDFALPGEQDQIARVTSVIPK